MPSRRVVVAAAVILASVLWVTPAGAAAKVPGGSVEESEWRFRLCRNQLVLDGLALAVPDVLVRVRVASEDQERRSGTGDGGCGQPSAGRREAVELQLFGWVRGVDFDASLVEHWWDRRPGWDHRVRR